MRRFAKPLYWLKPVPGVRIPPSPPDSRNWFTRQYLLAVLISLYVLMLRFLKTVFGNSWGTNAPEHYRSQPNIAFLIR
jgi:hypothetical protein